MEESAVLSPTYQEELDKTVKYLRKGYVMLYPTDTIWGLGCDSSNVSAVERVFEIKHRPRNKPMVLLMSDIEMLKQHVHFIHPRVETLLSHHRQPLTLIYDHIIDLPDHLLSEEGTCAIRVCHDPFCKEVIEKFGKPIISTSANISEQPFPKTFAEVDQIIKDEADYTVAFLRK